MGGLLLLWLFLVLGLPLENSWGTLFKLDGEWSEVEWSEEVLGLEMEADWSSGWL